MSKSDMMMSDFGDRQYFDSFCWFSKKRQLESTQKTQLNCNIDGQLCWYFAEHCYSSILRVNQHRICCRILKKSLADFDDIIAKNKGHCTREIFFLKFKIASGPFVKDVPEKSGFSDPSSTLYVRVKQQNYFRNKNRCPVFQDPPPPRKVDVLNRWPLIVHKILAKFGVFWITGLENNRMR